MGRRQTNAAHKYYIYNKDTNKSKCIVPGCPTLISGNHATNLTYHLSSKHEEIFKIVQKRKEISTERDKNICQVQRRIKIEKNPPENNDEGEEEEILSPKKYFVYKNKLHKRIPKTKRIMNMRQNNDKEAKVAKPPQVDEFYYFALSVAAQLRKLPIEVAMNIQTKIQSTLSLARVSSSKECEDPLSERVGDSSEDVSDDQITSRRCI